MSERTSKHGCLPGGEAVGARRCPPPAIRPEVTHDVVRHP
jgi:hypothetical protein